MKGFQALNFYQSLNIKRVVVKNTLKEKQKRYYMHVCDVESTRRVEGRKGQPRVTT